MDYNDIDNSEPEKETKCINHKLERRNFVSTIFFVCFICWEMKKDEIRKGIKK